MRCDPGLVQSKKSDGYDLISFVRLERSAVIPDPQVAVRLGIDRVGDPMDRAVAHRNPKRAGVRTAETA